MNPTRTDGSLYRRFALRFRAYRLGWLFIRWQSFKPTPNVRVLGKTRRLSLPLGERAVQMHEMTEIMLHDRYRLRQLAPRARTILDIGANAGIFSLAARFMAPHARIHAYEPNACSFSHLSFNTEGLDVQCHPEAVGDRRTSVALCHRENSLHTTTVFAQEGDVSMISFADAIDRAGGSVDFLKLDCEGAEWLLFEDPAPWTKVRAIGMEYHLWAKANSTLRQMEAKLELLGFNVLAAVPHGPSWGMLFAANNSGK